MLLVSMKSKTVFQTDTLYSCLLSLVSLSLVSFSLVSFSLVSLSLSMVSFTHSYRSIYIYMLHNNWEQFSFQPVLHGAHATQSHSFHPLTSHSSIHLHHIHIQLLHSFIPRAHALHKGHIQLLHSFIPRAHALHKGHIQLLHSFIPRAHALHKGHIQLLHSFIPRAHALHKGHKEVKKLMKVFKKYKRHMSGKYNNETATANLMITDQSSLDGIL